MNEMLKTLARRSFAAGRARNLIAVLAIALSAACLHRSQPLQ